MKKTIIIVIIISLSLFSGCKNNNLSKSENSEVFVMNTYVTQTVYGRDRKKAISNVNIILKDLIKSYHYILLDRILIRSTIMRGCCL